MILNINGRFYGQATTGVQRYGRELLAALDSEVADGRLPHPFRHIVVHVPQRDESCVPDFRSLETRAYGGRRGGHLWEQLDLSAAFRDGMLFCPGNSAPLRSLLRKRPVVVTIHDLSFQYFPSAYHWAYRAWYRMLTPVILKRAARVITVSRSELAAILTRYPTARGRLVAIQNGGAPEWTLRAPHEPPVDGPYVLYVGSLSARKNFPGVLAAFAHVAQRRQELRLVVVGSTSAVFSQLAEWNDTKTSRRVVFLGQIEDYARLASVYKGARCLVFPSYYEASPLPPIEAMAHGCPVVAADIPSLRERCEQAAEYCDPHDEESIAAAVIRVLEDENLACTLRRLGRDRAAQFSWQQCAKRTLESLAEVAVTGLRRLR